jgi:nitrous oxide reductase accessory protein NosL
MRNAPAALALLLSCALLPGCREDDPLGPPPIRLGDSICDECGMILSSRPYATATIVRGPRGPEPRLFDDFNCQVHYERAHADEEILARWSHDYTGSEWIRTEQAHFVHSPALRTPMASQVAAFLKKADAEALRGSLGGEVHDFDAMWALIAQHGPCCPGDAEQP